MFTDLLHSSYFSLFLIVALGFMLGRIKIRGLSLDVSAVIFIALLFGHYGVIIPKELGNFGLVLFIFTIGIQAGPGFFDSFRSKGKTLILITMLIICSACLTAVGLKYAFDIDTPSVVGLIAGALTSTPGLAVAIDSTHSPLASIAYGIAYPFGVIGVILFVKLLPKIMRVDLDKEARRLEIERRGQFPELITCIYRVTNSHVFNRTLMQINARAMTGAVISRLKHDDEISIPTAHTVLREGDYIQAVGSEESLDQLAVLIGKREEGELPLDKTQEIESLLLTKKDMINKQLGDLNLQKNFGCTVTRVRRSGIDLSPSPDLALKFGDKLMVVGEKEGLKGVARLLGNNVKKLSDTDFFPIAMGIVLGVLFGKINISFSDSLSFSPGLTGGVLMVALVLSAIGKTGPIIWSMSGPANQLLRQLGLLLFLAEVGTSAGKNLVATFQESGLLMFGVGAAITLVPMLVAAIVGRLVFKISLLDLLGTITGGMTSTPGLAAADSMVDSNIPSVAYATVYPIAMVFLILFIQIIASAVY
ncbi:aspartate:alanine exchanger family transporter [Bacteroides finegoldii]|uniref:aspartate:alanine exchanger family transporter n=1 Tax=Bacteroides finegoldii TaxID=338188 RepID=UPI00189C8F48|nr:TrkA C-terminal domain-containing protein [Bacteroides finegoldii]